MAAESSGTRPAFVPATTALLLCDMQNDFVHPEGAYARGGVTSAGVAAIVPRLATLAGAARQAGLLVAATLFTLAPGRGGAPLVAPHLRRLRPFLAPGDFAPGAWGQAVLDALGPVDAAVEKVAYDAFHQSRLEWVLRGAGVTTLIVGGIVTNGCVASTVRRAHAMGFESLVLEDGCATIDPAAHAPNIEALRSVATITTCAAVGAALAGA